MRFSRSVLLQISTMSRKTVFVAGFIGESNIIEGTMIRDYLVAFDGFEFECVDKGFEDNEEIEVVLRPEDLDIVDPGQAKIEGSCAILHSRAYIMKS